MNYLVCSDCQETFKEKDADWESNLAYLACPQCGSTELTYLDDSADIFE